MTTLILDGYNVIHAVPELARHLDRSLQSAREALVRLCQAYRARRGDIGRLYVVFDGRDAQAFGSPEPQDGGVREGAEAAAGRDGETLEEDPRAPLVDMLLEYQRFKSAAEELAGREMEQRRFFPRLGSFDLPSSDGPLEINLIDLLTAFRGILERAKERAILELSVRSLTLGERMVAILDLLAEADHVTFSSLFPETADRLFVVMTFLALLELLRQGTVKVRQPLPFSEILISRAIA